MNAQWEGNLMLDSDDNSETNAEDERVDWSYQALGRRVEGEALRLPHSSRCAGPAHGQAKVVPCEIVWRICGATFFLMKNKGGDGPHLALCWNGPVCVLIIVGTSALGCSNQDSHRIRPPSKTQQSGKEGKGGAQLENSTHTYTIDACVSKSSGSRCEVDGRVGRQLIVHLSSCTRGFCVALALVQHCCPALAIHGYCVEEFL